MRAGVIYATTLGFACGVALQTYLPISIFGLYSLAGLACLLGLLSHLPSSVRVQNRCRLTALALLCVVVGVWRMDAAQQELQTTQLHTMAYQEVELSGVVMREPEIRPQSLHLYVQTEYGMVLAIADRHETVRYGDEVTVQGRLEVPEPFAAELGRTFPYDGYLAARGVTHTMFYPEIAVTDQGMGNPLIAGLLWNKAHFIDRLESLIPEPQVGLAEGLFLGVRRAMSDETLTDFRTTGIIHIVVLSGFNVMLVVAFVQYTFSYVLPLRPRVVASMLAIIAYAITVGLTATVTRASIMAMLLLLAQYLSRTYEAVRGLFVAGAVMIAINPYLLVYDIGFQLSFVATLGLILVAPHLETMFATVPTKVGARGYVVATIATQIAVLPLLLYHVGEFSVVSPLVNLLILPMVPVAMMLIFATGTISALSMTLAQPVAVATHLSLTYILVIAEWFATLPFAAFWVTAFPFVVVPISYVALGWLYYWWNERTKRRVAMPKPVSANVTTDNSLADWTIVDITPAATEVSTNTKAASSRKGDTGRSGTDTPVFFR